MKQENIVNESDTAASSTLSKKRRTAVSKLAREMALLYSVPDVDSSTLAEEHELQAGLHLSETADFASSRPSLKRTKEAK